jgi:serine protease
MGSYIGGAWTYTDYIYTESPPPVNAALLSPTPGTVLGSTATFTWSPGTDVTMYVLHVGTTGPGTQDLYNSGYTTATSSA